MPGWNFRPALASDGSWAADCGPGPARSPIADTFDRSRIAERGRAAPPKELKGFPDTDRVSPKTPRHGGGLRKRWKGADGTIYEWDYQHGHVERYGPKGNHLGGYDAESGSPVSEAVNTRRVEP